MRPLWQRGGSLVGVKGYVSFRPIVSHGRRRGHLLVSRAVARPVRPMGMSKHDLRARPVFHHQREPTWAHAGGGDGRPGCSPATSRTPPGSASNASSAPSNPSRMSPSTSAATTSQPPPPLKPPRPKTSSPPSTSQQSTKTVQLRCGDGVVSFEFLFLRVLAFEKFLICFLQGEEGHGESDAIAISDEIHITRSLIPTWLHNVRVFIWNDLPVVRMELG